MGDFELVPTGLLFRIKSQRVYVRMVCEGKVILCHYSAKQK